MLREYAKQLVQECRTFLEQRGWLDPETGGPRVEVIEPLILPYDGPRWRELPEDLAEATYRAARAGAAHEVLGNPAAALAWYRVGQYLWRGPKRYREKHSIFHALGSDFASSQLEAAVCADRVGNHERARRFYEWAAENCTPTEEEVAQYTRLRQWDVLWEVMPDAAYALACLERWEEALALAEACQGYLERDRRRVRSVFGTGYTPVVLNPVVLALARYKVQPTEENRLAAARMLRLQAVASREELSFLWAVFYVLNLRARHPELVEDGAVGVVARRRGPRLARRLPHGAGARCLAFSPEGERLAVGLEDGKVFLWEVPEGRRLRHWPATPNRVAAVAFSGDGRWLATGLTPRSRSRDPGLRVWEAATGRLVRQLLRGEEANVCGVAFTPEGALVSAERRGVVRLWQVEKGRERRRWELKEVVDCLAMEPGARWLAVGGGSYHGLILVVPLGKGDVRVLEEHREAECMADPEEPVAEHTVTGVAATASDLLVAGTQDGTVQAWRVGAGEMVWQVEGAHSFEGVMAVAAGGGLAISAGWDGLVQAWGLDKGGPVWDMKLGEPVLSAALSPDGRLLAVGTESGMVMLYEL